MLHRVWQCPCKLTSGVFGATEKWCKKVEEQKDEFACFWMRGLVPKTWTEANLWPESAPSIVGCMTCNPTSTPPTGQVAFIRRIPDSDLWAGALYDWTKTES